MSHASSFFVWTKNVFILFLVVFPGFARTADNKIEDKNKTVISLNGVIFTSGVAETVSERFISVTFDTILLRDNWIHLNLSSPKVLSLAKHLRPVYLRVGGTLQDFLYFEEMPAKLNYSHKKHADLKPFNITSTILDDLFGFASKVGWDVLFGLNMLNRNPVSWEPWDAIKILSYINKKDYPLAGLELGNEPDVYNLILSERPDPKILGEDFQHLRALMQIIPFLKSGLLVGPDVTNMGLLNKAYMDFLTRYLDAAHTALDAVTIHQYYLNGAVAKEEQFYDPVVMDVLEKELLSAHNILSKHAPGKKIWLGETSAAWNSGSAGLSNSFIAGFLWLDKLGLAARYNVQVVLRQDFYGGNYGLIDYKTLDPNPDYWLSVLYKTLVGTKVLDVVVMKPPRQVRVYAHCTNLRRKNVCIRKKIKGENKENKITKGKSKQGKQRRIDHNLFSEKETTSSFTDCGGGGPLKNIQQKNVPAAAQKINIEEENEEMEEDLVSSSTGDDRTDVEQTAEVVVDSLLHTRIPPLTQNCTSPIYTVAGRLFLGSSLRYGNMYRSPYMTRSRVQFEENVDQTAEETTSSFTDCGGGGPLKNIQQKNVPAAAQKINIEEENEEMEEDLVSSSTGDDRTDVEQTAEVVVDSLLHTRIPPLTQNCTSPIYTVAGRLFLGSSLRYGNMYRSPYMTRSRVQFEENVDQTAEIIPIEGDFEVNDCLQKDFREIFPEIVISKELSDLRNGIDDNTPNFVSVNSVNCLKGAYPARLMREWDIFHKQKRSENDRPDIFDKNQLFILFNFGDGGSALETFKFSNVRQAKSVLQQVAYGLAIAESAVEFEHRDLHWGNVLVRPCPNENLHFKLKGSDIHLPSWGIEVSIIDFTLSRLQQDGCTVFCDLAKDDLLFEGKGDYQFDVYRLMREEIGNQWDRYCPKTNVYWVHYLADKLLKSKKFDEKSTREDNNILRSLRKFVREVTDYSSAANLVTTCPFMMASAS